MVWQKLWVSTSWESFICWRWVLMVILLILLSVQHVMLPLAVLMIAMTPITLFYPRVCYYFQISSLKFFASSLSKMKAWKYIAHITVYDDIAHKHCSHGFTQSISWCLPASVTLHCSQGPLIWAFLYKQDLEMSSVKISWVKVNDGSLSCSQRGLLSVDNGECPTPELITGLQCEGHSVFREIKMLLQSKKITPPLIFRGAAPNCSTRCTISSKRRIVFTLTREQSRQTN